MIGFFGGTFDPIHNGHLHAARTAATALRLDAVKMVLAAQPGHRSAQASVAQRWRMLELALGKDPLLSADDREVRRGSASYTVDTLLELRAELGPHEAFVWLLGWDAYRGLPTWRRWQELASLCHFGVLRRPGVDAPLDARMSAFTDSHQTGAPGELATRPAGFVVFIDAPMLPISATAIRGRLARGDDVGDLLPPDVWTYIKAHHLYGGRPA